MPLNLLQRPTKDYFSVDYRKHAVRGIDEKESFKILTEMTVYATMNSFISQSKEIKYGAAVPKYMVFVSDSEIDLKKSPVINAFNSVNNFQELTEKVDLLPKSQVQPQTEQKFSLG